MLAAIAAILGLTVPALAPAERQMTGEGHCGLRVVEHARVAETIDGDTVRLIDGRQVRLVGIQAPKLALGRKNFTDWPMAAEAKASLERLVQGQRVGLGYGGLKIDRNGRTLAHLYIDGTALWVQAAMISSGMARVYSWPDNRACVTELLARERVARKMKVGVWSLPFYRIRTPVELGGEIDSFQIVEGQVVSTAEVRGRVFLNFGRDYRTDFTVTIAPEDLKPFRAASLDPSTLGGKAIRVRGWISLLNGPEIEVTHPEQIEVLP
jgi:endonuclease YncB( thermonuclease family)